MREWKHYMAVVASAALGVVLAGGAWHLYHDHLAVHAVVDYLNKAVATQQGKAAPAEPAK